MPRRRNGWYWIAMAFVLLGLTAYANYHDLIGLYFGDQGYQHSEREVYELALRLESLKAEETALNSSVQGLDTDPLAMEAAIRRSKGFVRKGETVYRVEIPEHSVP